MRVGLLSTGMGNFGQAGFYNVQETGLAKALDRLVEVAAVYKLVPAGQAARKELLPGCRGAVLERIPAGRLGSSGLFSTGVLDPSLDALIYFSDTQLMLPRVARWAEEHRTALYPYIGAVESHSACAFLRPVMDRLARRNLELYRRLHCFAKTPGVENRLWREGVRRVTAAPVGLDPDLLYSGYEAVPRQALKAKHGYQQEERVLLFVGRFVPEKEPERMVELFRRVYRRDGRFRLLMVGEGALRARTEQKVRALGLQAVVRFADRVPNREIWELYRLAWAFVNLNRQEIFGMAILEAMYYGCKVVAQHAPGPDCLIEDGLSGWLVNTDAEAVERILRGKASPRRARRRVEEEFTWTATAEKMAGVMQREGCGRPGPNRRRTP